MKLYVIDNIKLSPDSTDDNVKEEAERKYNLKINYYKIIKRSLDSRNKNFINYNYRILAGIDGKYIKNAESQKDISVYKNEINKSTKKELNLNKIKIIITGFGPAGIFCALRLIEYGAEVDIIERGKPVDKRIKDINDLERKGILNNESNVVFGEGGAGTYSDGKLTSRSKSHESQWLFDSLVKFGAPEEINYESKPHLGTDKIREIVKKIREYLLKKGCLFFFGERLDNIIIKNGKVSAITTSKDKERETGILVLASGHSARDTYNMLHEKGIFIEKKGFAAGVRIEHPAELINEIQYGKSRYKKYLPAADYFLKDNNKKTGRGIYSFCMCPGGMVINSSSENEKVCVNGMSFSKRDSVYSNSAIVVTVKKSDTEDYPLSGIVFQENIEKKAFLHGGGGFYAPAQRITSFINGKVDSLLPDYSYRPGLNTADIYQIMPEWISSEIKKSLHNFDKKMKGFITDEGIIISPETRTSSPVRITRKDNFQSVNLEGLYPIGEGAGYSGGIVSSAVDGIRAADAIACQYG